MAYVDIFLTLFLQNRPYIYLHNVVTTLYPFWSRNCAETTCPSNAKSLLLRHNSNNLRTFSAKYGDWNLSVIDSKPFSCRMLVHILSTSRVMNKYIFYLVNKIISVFLCGRGVVKLLILNDCQYIFSETLLQSDIIGLSFGILLRLVHSLGGLWILGRRGLGSSGGQRKIAKLSVGNDFLYNINRSIFVIFCFQINLLI